MSAASLRVGGVTKRFGAVVALDGIELDVPGGSFAALLGPSGCGKTTLLRIVAGFDRAEAGTVEIGGVVVGSDAVHVPPERRQVGIVPQEGALFPHLSVAENVAFGLPRRERRGGRVEELLALVGLAGLGPRRPHELSGGQQQRVALARCLAPGPSVVLLDEPFAALDAGLRVEVREHTRRILQESGATAVLVTHDQEEALSLADIVVLLRDGRVVQSGDAASLYRDPVDAWAARFVGHATLLPAVLEGDVARTALGTAAVRCSRTGRAGRASVLLRPEDLRIVPGEQGTVVSHRFLGHESLVRVAVPGLEEDVVVRVPGALPPAAGTPVGLEVCGPGIAFPPEGPDPRGSAPGAP